MLQFFVNLLLFKSCRTYSVKKRWQGFAIAKQLLQNPLRDRLHLRNFYWSLSKPAEALFEVSDIVVNWFMENLSWICEFLLHNFGILGFCVVVGEWHVGEPQNSYSCLKPWKFMDYQWVLTVRWWSCGMPEKSKSIRKTFLYNFAFYE